MLERLKDRTRKLNQIPNINCGGCGIAALAIYKWIVSQGIVLSTKPVIFMYKSISPSDMALYSKNVLVPEEEPLIPPSHICIRHESNFIDSQFHTIGSAGMMKDKVFHSTSVEQLILTINNSVRSSIHNTSVLWAADFRREEFIPVIENIMSVPLPEVNIRNRLIIPKTFSKFLNLLEK